MENKDNLSALETTLADIEKNIKAVITSGLEMLKTNPSLEKEVLTMYIAPSMRIYDFFVNETVRTGTENAGKTIVKYAMFKRF